MNPEVGRYLCMKCLRQLGNSPVCPYCGYHDQTPQKAPFLPKRVVLAGRYLVGAQVSQNGDGITYVGFDLSQKAPVFLREFYPDKIVARDRNGKNVLILEGSEGLFEDSLQSFLSLWRKLARLRDLSALLPVYDIFEENDTAYAVSEYMEYITLRDYLLKNPTGQLTWEHARRMFMPVLSTLSMLHASGVIHRGISPTTLIVGEDGKLRLIGFSIRDARMMRGFLKPELFPGYAAIEQYGFEGKQGPWTDIYGFAAALYRALVGNTPLEATARVTNDRMMIPTRLAESLPAYVLSALGNALQILPEDRTQNVEDFRLEISAAPSVTVHQPMQSHTLPHYGTAPLPPVPQPQPPSYIAPPPPPVPQQTYPTVPAAPAPPFQPPYPPPQPQPQPQSQPQDVYSQPQIAPPLPEEEPEEEPVSKRSIVVSLILLLVLIVGAVLAVLFFKDKLTEMMNPGGETTSISTSAEDDTNVGSFEMPNFVGESYDSISAEWSGKVNFVVDGEEYSNNHARGTILNQDITPGTPCKEGETTVRVVISKGQETVRLPNVIGKNIDSAQKTLKGLGFVTDVIYIYNDGTQTANIVASVDLLADKDYPKGTMVTLQVWSEAETSGGEGSDF